MGSGRCVAPRIVVIDSCLRAKTLKMMMKSTPYWLDIQPGFNGGTTTAVEGRYDVAVIGGGLTGLSAALHLARMGTSVLLTEAKCVMAEASGRNGGQCNTGMAHDYAEIIKKHGRETAFRFHHAYSAAVDTVESLVSDESIDCGFRRCGKLKLAAKPSHFQSLVATQELMNREFGADTHLFDKASVRSEVDSEAFHGGLLIPGAAQLHVGRFGIGLAEAAVRHGATIHEQSALTHVKRTRNGFILDTTRGQARASQVLLATGTSRTGPLDWFRRRIIPVGSFIIVTEPLSRTVLDRLLPARRNYVTSRVIGNYFRITEDNRLLFGGRARFSMTSDMTDGRAKSILQQSLRQTFPALGNIRIDYCWGGLVDMTRDRLPRAGKNNGLHYAMGYSGHGVQMSAHMGKMMAQHIAGTASDNPWSGLSWPSIPGYFGTPWFLPLAGAWHQLKDRFC